MMMTVSGQPLSQQVAFVGPDGVGKTTAVEVVSDLPVVRSETGIGARWCPETRVGRAPAGAWGTEYGEWERSPGSCVAVLAATGQIRFGTTLRATVVRATHVVLWLYGHTEYALAEAEEWLSYLGSETRETPLALAVTRLEPATRMSALGAYRSLADRYAPGAPVIAADPRYRSSVEDVLGAVLATQATPRVAESFYDYPQLRIG